jgi:PAS domain S-box-containing protein
MGSGHVDTETLASALLDGVFVCDKSGNILFSNPAFARMVGHKPDAIATRNIAKDIVDRELEWKALVSLLEQGSPIHDYEIKFRRSDGIVLTVSLTAAATRDDEGYHARIAAVARDISTRKGVENELREKAFRIDILNRIAKLAGTHKDIRAVLLKVSEELKKILDFDTLSVGVTEEKGRHVEVFVPGPDSADNAVSLGKVPYEDSIVEKLRFGGGRAIIVEKEAGRKPFSEFAVIDMARASSMMAVPLTSRGRVLGSLNLMHSKQSEYNWGSAEALQMVADLLGGMIDNMVLFSTLEGKVGLQEALVKSSVELQKAISTQQIYAAIASHIRDVVRYKDLSFYVIDWRKRLVQPVYAFGGYSDEILDASGGIDEGIVGLVARTGKAEFVDDVDADPRSADIPGVPQEHNSMLAIPLMGQGEVIGVLELYRERGEVFTQNDLEAGLLFAQQASVALENAQLVSKLQDAKKEIEMLNDLMFHDINNYNFATLNYIETVHGMPDLPHEAKAPLEKSLHLIRDTAKLIENVKKLTKIGVMEPEDLVLTNLSDVLRKVVSGITTSSTKKVGIRLDTPEEAYIKANPLVEELFVNILANAVKYDPHDDVEVDVEVKKVLEDDRSAWKVCVTDNGYGVPDDKKALLFQKYVRLKPDTKISGSGLGLSICRALTDKFSGRIWVEDRVPGKSELGARFCVVFPAERHPKA